MIAITLANLTSYDEKLKHYMAEGFYDKAEIDSFIASIEETEANFITKSVDDLVNYYAKSEVYTQSEVNTLISEIPKFAIVVVDELPTEDISPTTIYLLRTGDEEDNLFTEYIYVDDEWEQLGEQRIDLSDYYTKYEVDNLLPQNVSELVNDARYLSPTSIQDYAVTGIKSEDELVYRTGPITLTKRDVGLSLVENKSPRQIIAQMDSADVTSALGFMPLNETAYKANSALDDGYVAKTNGAQNKVWGTDENGVPGWRTSSGGSSSVTGVKGSAESLYRTGDVNISPANIGLENVENKSSSMILSELTGSAIEEKIGILPIENGGTGNGVGYIQTGNVSGSVIGEASTIEGKSNIANGKQAHAEGYGSRASGNYSHAEGYNTTSSGSTSHAEGTNTIAGHANQHVSGKFNNNKDNTLLEIGNGARSNARSNAFEVYEDGYIATDNGARIKFGKNQDNAYGYYVDGSAEIHLFGAQNMSELTNDVGFITNTVTDLLNYYLKSDTYTKAEVNALVSELPKFSIKVVASLPVTDISSTTIYLVPSGESSPSMYSEYIYVENAWELLGAQVIDLSDYYTKTQVDSLLDNKVSIESGKGLSTNDFTDAYQTKLSGIEVNAEVNQNAFSNIRVGESVISSSEETDEIEILGSNVTITADTANKNVTIGITGTNITNALGYIPPHQDTDTTYSFSSGTNGFTVTPSNGVAQNVSVTPSIQNNITGQGTANYLAKFNGINSVTNGPALGADTTKYLRNDGVWETPFKYAITNTEPVEIEEGTIVFVYE